MFRPSSTQRKKRIKFERRRNARPGRSEPEQPLKQRLLPPPKLPPPLICSGETDDLTAKNPKYAQLLA